MSKPKLFVFIGKPGVGKTTLIKHAFSDQKFFDVKPYIVPHVKNDKWPEDKTLACYRQMYRDIEKTNEDIVLEIGTNHAEFNINHLAKLQSKFEIIVVLCDLTNEETRKRHLQRDKNYDMESFERRIKRDFPGLHIILLQKTDLPYFVINMGPSTEQINKILQSKLA